MKQLRVRKVITEASNNEFFVFFQDGNIKEPVCILDIFELTELESEINHAKQDHNVNLKR